ncbi:MAG: CsgG/HfaB family protein [Treponema sp.]|jgi:TolB-like protein|nr:CsgG/HfaB family protein [Treponema sp.]
MNKFFLFILILLFPVFAFSQNAVGIDTALQNSIAYLNTRIQPNTKVVVLNFSSVWPKLSEYVVEELIGHIVNDGKLTVVDRTNLDIIRQEMDFQLSGEVSNESAQAIGHKLGAQSIISGSIIDTGSGIRLRLRIIAVETAQMLGMHNINLAQDNRLSFLTRIVAEPEPVRVTAAVSTQSGAPAEYIGTWVNSSANTVLTIQANRLTFLNRTSNTAYTIENLTWTPHRNGGNMASTHPTGYAISGTVTKNEGWSHDPSAANFVSRVGSKYTDYWFINSGKRTLNLGQRNTKEHYGTASVYTKQ